MALTKEELKWATLLALSTPVKRGTVIERIRITQLPKVVDYPFGGPIDLTGIVVHAYYADGSDYGVIPVQALLTDPTNARYADGFGPTSEIFTIPINCAEDATIYVPLHSGTNIYNVEFTSGNGLITTFPDGRVVSGIAASSSPGAVFSYSSMSIQLNLTYTYKGSTVYYQGFRQGNAGSYGVPSTDIDISLVDRPSAAWTMIYGSGKGSVTVGWPRPSDGRILTDTFDIRVSSPI